VLNRETRALRREWEKSAGDVSAFLEAASTFYAGHLPFVAEALVVSNLKARAYCFAQAEAITAAVEAKRVPALLTCWETGAEVLYFTPLPAEPKDDNRKEKP
jgi:hypothetical protein